jgi:(p)ppGpp synthase/HD superfamily hydrolase
MGVVLGIPNTGRGLPQTRAALCYAQELHAGQLRKADGAPFILHPREVAALLYHAGAPDHLIAAGALHDVIEKTRAVPSELRERFGGRVAMLVLAVSEDEQIDSYAARKAALRERVAKAGEEALMLFAADKVSKARELRLEDAAAHRARSRRLAHYQRCLALLQEHLPESPLVAQFGAELRAIDPSVLGKRPDPAGVGQSRRPKNVA